MSSTQRQDRSTGVQQMPAGSFFALPSTLPQACRRRQRSREGDRADENAEEDLDLHDRQFHRVLWARMAEKPVNRERAVSSSEATCASSIWGVEADENGGKTDEGVKGRHKLRHFGHLHAACDEVAEDGAAGQHQEHDEPLPDALADFRTEDGGDDGEAHSNDAVPDGTLGAFLSGKTPRERMKRTAAAT